MPIINYRSKPLLARIVPFQMGGAIVRAVDSQRQDAAYKSIMEVMTGDVVQERLDLSHFGLYTAPSVLDKLASIVDLNLSSNYITVLPSSFGVLTCVEILQLDDNRLKSLPNSIGDLRRLRIFSMTRNKCTSLPEIKNLLLLEKFYCDQNNLTSLPELPINIISISCNKNQIGPMLPDTITNLKALRFLDVNNNRISMLSHTMGRLHRLIRFDVGNNKITQMNTEREAMYGMKSLTCLSMSGNSLLFLPEELGLLDSLTQLNLSNNKTLTLLPPELGELCDLKSLSINDCGLTKLPEGLDDYTTCLRDIDLSTNSIVKLHPCIGSIISLKVGLSVH